MTGLTFVLMLVALGLAFFAQYAARRAHRERNRVPRPAKMAGVTLYDDLFRNRPRSPVSRDAARFDMEDTCA